VVFYGCRFGRRRHRPVAGRYDGAGHGFQDFHDPERWRADEAAAARRNCFVVFDARVKASMTHYRKAIQWTCT